ncbi:MAG: hypothetical protein IKN93_01960 [Bacteroidales bacterium]|nr:hypothetical protein [Bacteroidales bacterium]
MNTNNPQQKRYRAPEMKVLFIRTETLCTSSQTETAIRENYILYDLFD